jgi:hypothetical protein
MTYPPTCAASHPRKASSLSRNSAIPTQHCPHPHRPRRPAPPDAHRRAAQPARTGPTAHARSLRPGRVHRAAARTQLAQPAALLEPAVPLPDRRAHRPGMAVQRRPQLHPRLQNRAPAVPLPRLDSPQLTRPIPHLSAAERQPCPRPRSSGAMFARRLLACRGTGRQHPAQPVTVTRGDVHRPAARGNFRYSLILRKPE